MLRELSEDLSSIKKIQSEIKDTLIEIKTNLQGNNRADEEDNQISDLEQKETNKSSNNKKKKESRKMKVV